ncbi:hypothetical protein [Ligilactobacillus acidipiscis]|uniref:hypothetical protein n=1 Tax=Ligilactobacillus acidipiscis TaxID=89059 RepID=UPI0023F7D0D7|nr:hypothetical protein [Ligilactobacillus acidipiscis]WEV56129.1 hypothetical protein OZX66_07685 [Ligilactobacillus acidipiscis]
MAINLDTKYENKLAVTIGGKDYDILLNDKFVYDTQHTVLVVNKLQDKLDKMSEDDFAKMSLEEQEKFADDIFADMRKEIVSFFDKFLGDSEGERLYKYYNEDTEALGYVLGQLNKLAGNKQKSHRANKRKEYMNNKR